MTFLQRALEDKHAHIVQEGKYQKITYAAAKVTERYDDPEEKVRAEFWAELIYRYQYDPACIGVEVTVPDRLPADRVDLVVFRDAARKAPYAVVECKKDGITDAEFHQAIEQAFGNGHAHKFRAEYVMVVAGATRRAFDCSDRYPALEREQNVVADLPLRYSKPQEYKYTKGGMLDIQPVSKSALISAIQKCHQTLWGGGKLSPPVAFGELCKLIFVKISDEQKPRKNGTPYEFQIKTHEPPRGLGGRIRALYEEQRVKDPEVFSEAIKISDQTLATVVAHLESVHLNKTDLDTKGLAFEQFMDGFFKGNFGQYFTPREVIDFSVQMLPPTHTDFVLDPACGSGGFLLHALDAVRNEASEYYTPGDADHFRHWHDFAQQRLFGMEINDEIARVAKMNMILHDDGHTNVVGTDSLDDLAKIRRETGNNGFAEGRFDLVLTNPPFGASFTLTERPYIAEYDLGKTTDPKGRQKPRPNQKTEILFLERVQQFLKPGTGRAAVVMPDGILTNSSLQYVRDYLLKHFQLLAVVSLPQTAFAHYGAGVKSSVVFLRKRGAGEESDPDEAVFMAAPENIGYDATGRKTKNDLADVVAQFREFQKDPAPFFV